MAISAAPSVDTTGLVLVDSSAVPIGDALHLQPTAARSVKYNLPASQMHAPSYGPANPNDNGAIPAGLRNHWAGHAENAYVSSYSFDEQYNSFQSQGRAADPGVSGKSVVSGGSLALPDLVKAPQPKRQKTTGIQPSLPIYDPSAPFTLRSRQPWAEKEAVPQEELTEEQRAAVEALKTEKAKAASEPVGADHSIFHGKEQRDYQGRSWVEPPSDLPAASDACFLPKRHVHTWTGHTKGVATVRLFPGTGHLLLSAGLDAKVKVWDVTGGSGKGRQCMRTYVGHSKGVRDVWFFPDGSRFASTAYDKTIKIWDTETGASLGTFGQGQMAYTVRCHPDPGEPSVLLAGMQNKKILQFDTRTGDVVQEYNYHLAAVNTVTFVDGNRRFISTSDDKSIRIWEFGIPVQVKYIADASMHAISTAALTANGKWWLGQSADNSIVTYSADDRTRPNRKKTFKGHSAAGYACQVNASHDCRYIISGDGEGKLFIWDWKSGKIVRSLKAHEGPCVGAEWHPLETSKVVTCGWDGLIKYWD